MSSSKQSSKREKPIELTDSNYFSTIKSEGFLFTDFWASWCGPCMTMGPVVEELAEEFAGRIKFAKLNVDENPVVPQQFGIMSIPTFILSNRGKVVDLLVGAMPKQTLAKKLEGYLKVEDTLIQSHEKI